MRRGVVVVTGAAGQVGAQVVKALREEGYGVRAALGPGEKSSAAASRDGDEGCVWSEVELLDREAVGRLVRGAQGVIHAARQDDPSLPWDDLYEANSLSVERVAEAAVQAGVDRFVYVSSAGVYGKPEGIPVAEGAAVAPRGELERSFAQGEEAVWQAQRFEGLRAAVLRPGWIYGAGGTQGVANLMAIYAVAKARSLPWIRRVQGGPMGHHVHAEDVARASVLLLQRIETIGQAYNVADATPLSWGEVCDFVCDLCNVQVGNLLVPGPVARAVSVLGQWVPSEKLVGLNRELARHWEALRVEQKLEGRLHPRLSRDMFEVLGHDMVLEVEALSALGFRWSYPRTLAGLRETYDGYMERRWLPGQRDLEVGPEGADA